VIICDDARAFLGSQGLARMELDARREVGAIVEGAEVIGRLRDLFEADWAQAKPRPGIVMPRRAWQPEVACLS
jgi:hypothetical protein